MLNHNHCLLFNYSPNSHESLFGVYSTGEYIQLPLQLEEILHDVLQLADLANENDQVVSIASIISYFIP